MSGQVFAGQARSKKGTAAGTSEAQARGHDSNPGQQDELSYLRGKVDAYELALKCLGERA
jgi:hypothetical protein